jgi:hypothetical protein
MVLSRRGGPASGLFHPDAEMVDISPNFISDIETGKRWLSSDMLVSLGDALNSV